MTIEKNDDRKFWMKFPKILRPGKFALIEDLENLDWLERYNVESTLQEAEKPLQEGLIKKEINPADEAIQHDNTDWTIYPWYRLGAGPELRDDS